MPCDWMHPGVWTGSEWQFVIVTPCRFTLYGWPSQEAAAVGAATSVT